MPKVSVEDLAQRRQDILEGARRCFTEFGYGGATVARLEAATGKSRGAIFHHFGSKEGLFLALAEEDSRQMAELTEESGLVEVMRDLIANPDQHAWLGTRLEVVRRLRTDAEFRQQWFQHQEHLDHAVRERLSASAEAGALRSDIPPESLRLLLELLLDGLITRIATGQPTDGVSDVLDRVEASVRSR
ncbi:TetR/AcrR family transcriptional regulator [Corynebacterium sp. TAE3-ERU12]|uniref:TetR/AcrR family transcriptional regulator n=1 Tax=Corynebacterium sp. TAE3-ERU12 TaxID=2849491 RepID=UPI001C45B200|nr:TetR/AcrR family transcriptional regulator [Corynebacterium sp. TAE3-ERU12]MBV7295437.1 TetR/AcrR family transcriptional regulator [Corynebacterium sp. TAE3-ERU12]